MKINFRQDDMKYWIDYMSNHLFYLFFFKKSSYVKSYEGLKDAFNTYTEIFKLYFQCSVNLIPITKYYINRLLIVSNLADRELSSSKEKENCVDDSARVLRGFFSKFQGADNKNNGILYCIISLIRIYFKLKTYRNCKSLVEWVDKNKVEVNIFPKSEITTFYYYTGRLSIYEIKIKEAQAFFNNAFTMCNNNSIQNKRLILEYLIPVNLFVGIIPSNELLDYYNIENSQLYRNLISSFRSGDLKLYNQTVEDLEDRLITLGTFLIFEKLKCIVMRNFMKRIHKHFGNHVIPLTIVYKILTDVFDYHEMNFEELELYLLSVIYKGLINGYIHHQNKVIVFAKISSKINPFPKLSDAFEKNYNKFI